MADSVTDHDPLGRLADEFLERYRRGEHPALTEYTRRYPELADRIRDLFRALVMLEDVRPGTGPAERPPGPDWAGGPPRQLGEYRIVREIGRGGMGVVYEAEQESLGRCVALKVLPPGALAQPEQVARFRREARAAARLHHTNIVPVFGVGQEGGTHYYVMQYIKGHPLDDVLDELRQLRDQAAPRSVPPGEHSETKGGTTSNQEPSPLSGDARTTVHVARSLWEASSVPRVDRVRLSERPTLGRHESSARSPRTDQALGPGPHRRGAGRTGRLSCPRLSRLAGSPRPPEATGRPAGALISILACNPLGDTRWGMGWGRSRRIGRLWMRARGTMPKRRRRSGSRAARSRWGGS